MAFHIVKDLPSAEAVAERYPVTPAHRIPERRQEIKNVLAGTDPRLLMIVGPCSAFPSDAVREYADRLTRLQEEVGSRLLLVLRTYIQKPRTTVGWPGPLNQPDPLGPVDIGKGIYESRRMMHDVGRQLPLADEMLFTHNASHFEPLLSYIAVGARSTEDMEHRYIASGFDTAVGVKNTTGGNIEIGVNGVQCVQTPHEFAMSNRQMRTDGNAHAHLVLRGGGGRSNYDPGSLAFAEKLLKDPKRGIRNPAIVVDTSHDNSLNGHGKDPELQAAVVHSVLWGIRAKREEYALVRGFMMESFLEQGAQKIGPDMKQSGLSITDPCLGWDRTQRLLRETADTLS